MQASPALEMAPGIAVDDIPAVSEDRPGSGDVALFRLEQDETGAPRMVQTDTVVSALNFFTGRSIAKGDHVWVQPSGDKWFIFTHSVC